MHARDASRDGEAKAEATTLFARMELDEPLEQTLAVRCSYSAASPACACAASCSIGPSA